MVSALSSAVSGLRDATLRVEVAANNIANLNTQTFAAARVVSEEAPAGGVASRVTPATPGAGAPPDLAAMSGTDLETEMISLTVAKIAFSASARMIRTAAELDQAVLDIRA
jgi:flagellar hook-associated protein FlgK